MKIQRKPVIKSLLALVLCLVTFSTLTSCDDDDYWYPANGGYIDSALVGSWELVQIDGKYVPQANANYFSFGNNGYGNYYYYDRGVLYREPINFYSETGNYGNAWLIIDYSDGSSAEQQYWFSDRGRSLWMQFTDYRGYLTTYRYEYVSYVPY